MIIANLPYRGCAVETFPAAKTKVEHQGTVMTDGMEPPRLLEELMALNPPDEGSKCAHATSPG